MENISSTSGRQWRAAPLKPFQGTDASMPFPPPLVPPIEAPAGGTGTHEQDPDEESGNESPSPGSLGVIRVVRLRVSAWWEGFAVPSLSPADKWNLSAEERNKYHRSRILASVVGKFCLGLVVTFPITLYQVVSSPTISTFLDVFLVVVLIGACFGWVRINHDGHVQAAALVAALTVIGLITFVIVSGDFAVGGYNWSDAPGWDIMIVGLLIIALTGRLWQAWVLCALYCSVLLAIVTLVPAQSSVLPTDVAAALLAAGVPPAQATVPLDIDLLFRPFIMAVLITLAGSTANQETMQAFRERDGQEDLAKQRQQLLHDREKQVQYERQIQKLIHEFIARQSMAWHSGWEYTPLDLPLEAQDNPRLVDIWNLLNGSERRMRAAQLVLSDVLRWHRDLRLLPLAIEQEHLDGVHADEEEGMDELERIALVSGGVHSPEVSALILEIQKVIRREEDEDWRVRNGIHDAAREWVDGSYKRRVSTSLESLRLGDIVAAFNMVLSHAEAKIPLFDSSRGSDGPT